MARAGGPIIGIDLGTTNSVAAYFDNGEVRFIENALGQPITPSVVAVDQKTQTLLAGRTAKDIWAVSPHLAAATFKRAMGSDKQFALGKRNLGPVELSAYVLDAIRSDAERALATRVERCVVTVPAYFNDSQRFATKRAAEAAGMAVERVLNEPTAAAIAYGLDRSDEESTFLVFDLGGGTFDVCVMELFEGMLAVKGVAGDSQLGGEDFTQAVLELACEAVGIDAQRARSEDLGAYAILYKRAELLKRQLSSWQAGAITVPPIKGQTTEAISAELTSARTEQAFARLLGRLMAPCRSALRGAGVTPSDLSQVILVGGATRMPCVRKLVEELFKRQPLTELDPDLVVAQGAAVQAGLCADDQSLSDIVVTDVSSHSLGVDVAKKLATRYRDGYFSPIIHRNTVIPTSRTEYFAPVADGQTEVEFGVFEGDSRRVEDNAKIGSFKVKSLPAKRDEANIAVTFTYDLNGILEVEARVESTGQVVNRIFTRTGKDLSGLELERATSRLRQIKSDPGERPRNKDLVTRADLLWQEVSEEQRHLLGLAIDQFQEALASRDEGAIEASYEQLLSVCHSLDGGERW